MRIIIDSDSSYHSEEVPPTDKTRREDESKEGAGDKGDQKESIENEHEKNQKLNRARKVSTATNLPAIQDHVQSYEQITFR